MFPRFGRKGVFVCSTFLRSLTASPRLPKFYIVFERTCSWGDIFLLSAVFLFVDSLCVSFLWPNVPRAVTSTPALPPSSVLFVCEAAVKTVCPRTYKTQHLQREQTTSSRDPLGVRKCPN